MGAIRRLPAALVNRIAAGECVERPASVVKELVENALDAGAARVDVTVVDGGRGLIRVVDDGVGIAPDDLPLAVAQHATSKIAADEDLFNIHTMGFRGEALASIASVARLRITSRQRGSDVAYELRAAGGEVGAPTPCAAPPGTAVEVADLFYCVPARRRFLKTNQTEMGHITEQFARIALAHPGVAFSLRHEKRVFHDLPAAPDRRQRIADFFGPELSGALLDVQRAGTGVQLDGFVSPPAESRGSSKWEYVFVNGRYVRDKFVSHAVKEAYRSLIDPSRYPVAFLFIAIDPQLVDVNVHPTKIEVRWRDSNHVHGHVLAALRDKFLSTNLDHAYRPRPSADDDYRERVRAAMVDFFTRAQPANPQPLLYSRHAEDGGGERPRAVWTPPRAPSAAPIADRAAAVLEPRSGALTAPAPREAQAAPRPDAAAAPLEDAPSTQPSAGSPEPDAAPLRAIQVHRAFLVAEVPDGLMIIDQHALHERVLYEELRKRMTQQRLEAQRYLIPEVVRVPPDRLEVLEARADLLARIGVELTAAGPQSVALQAFPTLLLDRVDPQSFVRDLLDLLAEHGAEPNTDTLLHAVLDVLARKAAVKAGDPLTGAEIDALLARRALAERSSHCPHGRPTTLHLTLRELERQFKRR